jgi:hypothetical protein
VLTINVALARKATQYAPFVGDGHGQIEVMVLAMNSGGRMSDDFHKVLYAFAHRKVAKTLGPGGAEEDRDALFSTRGLQELVLQPIVLKFLLTLVVPSLSSHTNR